jgi:hypothetical protein
MRKEGSSVNTNTMVFYAVGGWVTAPLLVLTCLARRPAALRPTSIDAVDRLVEHSRAATAALGGIARAATPDSADLLAEARCANGRCRQQLAPVLAEFGPESDVGRGAMSLLASLQAAVDRLELAVMREDACLAVRPWVLAEPPLAAIRLAQDRLMGAVWRTLERRAGRGERPAPVARTRTHPG